MSEKKVPKRVYKYRAFSGQTLDILVADKLYFADPSTFNDPLDTNPSLETNIGSEELERILSGLVQQRITAEMTDAAKSIKYKGPKTIRHIDHHSRRQAERLISEIRYSATNPEYEFDDPLKWLLGHYLERELLQRYDRGIVAFAGSAVCPLMWSHYGEQHRGIAVGYSIPTDTAKSLHKIHYGGSRLFKASKAAAMFDGDEVARREVDEAVLLRKAQDWQYEREWRLIGERGLQDSPLELEEVIFGMRCPIAVQYAIIKALEDRSRDVEFYEIGQQQGSFVLEKKALEANELLATLPRRARSTREAFRDLPIPNAT